MPIKTNTNSFCICLSNFPKEKGPAMTTGLEAKAGSNPGTLGFLGGAAPIFPGMRPAGRTIKKGAAASAEAPFQ
jgi:hypothetical protein